ncbi:MAG: 16S rRNA (cytosine(1402)-N(4))-methyltransferase RsmH [Gemmataceae bacterium]
MRHKSRSTPPGQHVPVLLQPVLDALAPQPGAILVDCTTGWAGHSAELLQRVGPTGRLFCLDLDQENLARAAERLEPIGHPFSLHHSNFAGVAGIVGQAGIEQIDGLLADLGMSSMQVDDPARGFSYAREGPLDMRMDRSRGRTAAELLASMSEAELARALADLGDEPEAARLAPALGAAARAGQLVTTTDLARLILETLGQPTEWRLRPGKNRWTTHPAARTFQTLRILVNRELANLTQLLRVMPTLLKPGGVAAIISFHSGEDRLVKAAFRDGERAGIYEAISSDPLRASYVEKVANPRARSAKLRWARRAKALDAVAPAIKNDS